MNTAHTDAHASDKRTPSTPHAATDLPKPAQQQQAFASDGEVEICYQLSAADVPTHLHGTPIHHVLTYPTRFAHKDVSAQQGQHMSQECVHVLQAFTTPAMTPTRLQQFCLCKDDYAVHTVNQLVHAELAHMAVGALAGRLTRHMNPWTEQPPSSTLDDAFPPKHILQWVDWCGILRQMSLSQICGMLDVHLVVMGMRLTGTLTQTDMQGDNLLTWASRRSSTRSLECILEHIAELPNASSMYAHVSPVDNNTALMNVCARQHAYNRSNKLVLQMLPSHESAKRTAIGYIHPDTGTTALLLLAQAFHYNHDAIEHILRVYSPKECALGHQCNDGYTVLLHACLSKCLTLAHAMLQTGEHACNLNAVLRNVGTAWSVLMCMRDVRHAIMRDVVQARLDWSVRLTGTNMARTPLLTVCSQSPHQSYALLALRGDTWRTARLSAVCQDATVLMIVLRRGWMRVAQRIVEACTKGQTCGTAHVDAAGESALSIAMSMGRLNFAHAMLKKFGPSACCLARPDRHGVTPLVMLCSQSGHAQAVQSFVANTLRTYGAKACGVVTVKNSDDAHAKGGSSKTNLTLWHYAVQHDMRDVLVELTKQTR